MSDEVETAESVDHLLEWLGTPPGFRVWLFLRDDPRRLAQTAWPNRTTVNGGYAIPGTPEVTIYRAEEYQRVLIHEVIHAMNWDIQAPTAPLACWGLPAASRLYPHLFEAFTELYAEWLYCIFHDILWEVQVKYARQQALQILSRYDRSKPWEEDTNVFAYYILKVALTPYLPVFLLRRESQLTEMSGYLCDYAQKELHILYEEATTITPVAMSLRMTVS